MRLDDGNGGGEVTKTTGDIKRASCQQSNTSCRCKDLADPNVRVPGLLTRVSSMEPSEWIKNAKISPG